MKRLILSLTTVILSLATWGQQAGDKFVIKTTEAVKKTEWSLAGGDAFSDISIIKHNGDKLELFAKGYENMGAWATYDLNQIESITFTVFHKGDYQEESAAQAVKNMGLGTCFGNCLDAVDINKTMEKNSVTDFEKCWGQEPTTKPMVDFLKKNGFNSVRIAVTWFQHMKEDGTVDEAWMNRVQEVVDYVIDNGMYCILNVHHDTGAAPDDKSYTHWIKADLNNYNANKTKFEYLWTQIANRFKSYDQHLVFEGYNEMLDANNTWNAPKNANSYKGLNGYAQSFVNAVRATGGNNETRNLIVNTYAAACGDEVLNNLTIPTDKVSGHIAVEVHTYAPWDWFATKGAWDGSCSNEIKSMFTRLNNKFISKGIPCIIGEYGTHGSTQVSKKSTASQIQAAADQAADIVKQAKAYGVATFYWMSIFEGTDRTVPQWTLPTVVEAMQKAYKQ